MQREPNEHINDLWEDMDRLNALYEELMWDHDLELEFKADYENNCIIIITQASAIEIPVFIVIPSPNIKYVINGKEIIPTANPINLTGHNCSPNPL